MRRGFGFRAAILIVVLLLLLVQAPAPVRGWGCEGHEAIALIAEKHLTAHARQVVRDLLQGAPVDPRMQRFCHPTTSSVMAEASTWADDVRRAAASPFRETGNWHFIDIPLGVSSGDLGRFCSARKGCVLQAINEQMAVLRTDRRAHRRAEALRFLIHLVGDLHQPLHTTTNNDRGGNCMPVTYLGIEPQLAPDHPEDGVYQPNLHGVWDTNIIRHLLDGHGSAWLADLLDRRFQWHILSWQDQAVDLNQWAWESHEVAEQTVYGLLPTPIRREPPGRETPCGEMSVRMLALHERLTEPYQNAAVPVVEEQLAKAGARLALLLNRIWP